MMIMMGVIGAIVVAVIVSKYQKAQDQRWRSTNSRVL